jgi:hypothetical protein
VGTGGATARFELQRRSAYGQDFEVGLGREGKRKSSIGANHMTILRVTSHAVLTCQAKKAAAIFRPRLALT